MPPSTPASDPPTPADLDHIEATIDAHPPESMILIRDIGPLVKRLVDEVRRLMAENARLRERVKNLESWLRTDAPRR